MRCFFFTMHRSGSMALHNTLLHAANELGATLVAPNSGGVQISLRQLWNDKDKLQFPASYICGALRGFVDFPQLAEAQILLHLRDPRDVLTSMFFSYCYSHAGEEEGDTGHRREVAERGIDWFVLELSEKDRPDLKGGYGTGANQVDFLGNVRQRYQAYMDHLLPLPQTRVLAYEDMVERPDRWIEGLNAVLGLPDAGPIRQIIGADDAPGPSGEDKWAHRRQSSPGDHKRKLQDATVARLNEIYRPVLEAFNYKT